MRGKPGRWGRWRRPRGLIPARAGKTCPTPSPRTPRRAHPRACGENVRNSLLNPASAGSSPRVRGKRAGGPVVRGRAGLIPARAGKTPCGSGARGRTRVHPRACGENIHGSRGPDGAGGSSPRVRGKPFRRTQRTIPKRLIPARAGKTVTLLSSRLPSPAHPRACGENCRPGRVVDGAAGSSPRVRGKLPRVRNRRVDRGLIPARAGKTFSMPPGVSPPSAHPRACGENQSQADAFGYSTGSSPRVRGKPARRLGRVLLPGLIPARAGKTRSICGSSGCAEAHPRACGENQRTLRYPRHQAGSSPRVRGKLILWGPVPVTLGLIPARAGKTFPDPAKTSIPAAHPRACGENCAWCLGRWGLVGSSPRVRGKPRRSRCCPRPRGLIPARAGKTKGKTTVCGSQRAHPRACGENLAAQFGSQAKQGSSPRVRGKPGC